MPIQIFAPVSSNGKNEKDDENRVDEALQITGHTPKTPSRFVNNDKNTVIDGIIRFQRQNGLKVDGTVNPGGPTERALKRKVAQAERPKPTVPTSPNPPTTRPPAIQGSTRLPKPTTDPVDPEEMYRILDYKKSGPGDVGNAIKYPRRTFSKRIPNNLDQLKDQALRAAKQEKLRSKLTDGEGDAFRHAYWSLKMAKEFGKDFAKQISDGHERRPLRFYRELRYRISSRTPKVPNYPDTPNTLMDLYNNQKGRELLIRAENMSDGQIRRMIVDEIRTGKLQTTPFQIRRR